MVGSFLLRVWLSDWEEGPVPRISVPDLRRAQAIRGAGHASDFALQAFPAAGREAFVTKSATDVMQEIISSAVLDAIDALKAGSKGMPNTLLRDLNAIHANTAFADLPKELQAAVAASVRSAFTRLLKEGYSVAPAAAAAAPQRGPRPTRPTDGPRPPRPTDGPRRPRRDDAPGRGPRREDGPNRGPKRPRRP